MINLWLMCPKCPTTFMNRSTVCVRAPKDVAFAKLMELARQYGWQEIEGNLCCHFHVPAATDGRAFQIAKVTASHVDPKDLEPMLRVEP
jgi:hypothetical protein